MRKQVKFALYIVAPILLLLSIYLIGTGRVNNNKEIINFEVEQGQTYSSLATTLKEEGLIKSKFFYKLYIKIHSPKSLQAGTYELSSNMNVKKIVKTLETNTKHSTINITFKEGINFRKFVSLITENTSIKEEEIYNKIKDKEFLNELIEEYWFLTDEIKNDKIYYSLEGYLFPDTYNFDKNSSIEDIFRFMLDNTEKKLEKYKNKTSKYSIHEMLTMASIVELEASNSNDRAGVAGVFYNRLEHNWSLGSDVTTYYAEKIDLNERDLYQSELNEYNAYNTRSSKMAGKLPVSPICMPGMQSIDAAFNPEKHNYYYFVADKNGKTYFNKTSSGHTSTVAKLKSEGLWYQY